MHGTDGGGGGAARETAVRARVMVVDDEPVMARSLVRVLQLRGFEATAVADPEEAIQRASDGEADVMLLDLQMPRMSGMEVLERVRHTRPDVEVILMTAFGDVDTAVAAVKAGAYDFLTKPFPTNDAIALAVEKAAEHRRLVHRTRQLEDALVERESFSDLVGNAPSMREVFRLVEGVAASTSTVLVLGESGTGKELVARAIHRRSTRAHRPLVAVNCGAIPQDLVESELFGHMKGAFTGATAQRQGLFEAADGGTIFLDEVGDLPLPAQVKLLRTLQEGEVKRVGANEARTVDVRVIAATNVDLRKRVDDGRFREDLFYRLNVISLQIPALRERREDIALLASHFLKKYSERLGRTFRGFSPDAIRALEANAWRGNVRELENAIERAVVLARGELIGPEDLPRSETVPVPPQSSPAVEATAHAADTDAPYTEARRRALEHFERVYIRALLARTDGNISEAARRAGLDRSNFKRVLRRVVTAENGGVATDEDES